MSRKTPENIGLKSGRLTVLRFGSMKYLKSGKRRPTYVCLCSCGAEVEVMTSNILNGHTQSCGCLQRERTSKANATHRLFRTPEHVVWMNMLQRCRNPNNPAYRNYGGRGIEVCERWTVFENFLADMGTRPHGLTIERVNNELGYNKDNCVWADRETQAHNRRGNLNYRERYDV